MSNEQPSTSNVQPINNNQARISSIPDSASNNATACSTCYKGVAEAPPSACALPSRRPFRITTETCRGIPPGKGFQHRCALVLFDMR